MDPSLGLSAPQQYDVIMNFSYSNHHLNLDQEVLKNEKKYFLSFFKILSNFPALNNNHFLLEPYSKGCLVKSRFGTSYAQIQKLSQITQIIFSRALYDGKSSGIMLAKTLKNESNIYITEPRKKINLALEEETTACLENIFDIETLMDIISNVAMGVGLTCQTSQETVFISHDEGRSSAMGQATYIKLQNKNSQPNLHPLPEQSKKIDPHQDPQPKPEKEKNDEKTHALHAKEQFLKTKEENLLVREDLLEKREKKIAEKEKLLKEKEEEDVCVICYDRPINAIPLPCAHLSFCIECIMDIQTCSICNGNIAQKVRVYRS